MKKTWTTMGIVAVLAPMLALAACSGSGSGNYPAFTATPTVSGDTVSIPAATVNARHNVHFNLKFDQGTAGFMAYTQGSNVMVRASICVPCRGQTYTVSGNKLICDTCGTVFSAETGKGISGVTACKGYPKASVPFTTSADGSLVMSKADLLTAFENTLAPGLP